MAQLECSSAGICLAPQIKDDGENYVGLLVRTSLMLASDNLPPEVQCHGVKMIEHLLKCRCEELSSADRLNLTVGLVTSPDEDRTLCKTANSRLENKHESSLLVLSTNNNLRNLAAEETDKSSPSVSSNTSGTRSETSFGSSTENSKSSNTSGTRSETSFEVSTESSKSSNLPYTSPLGLSFDAVESELEVQMPMPIDISENDQFDGGPVVEVGPKDQYSFDTRIVVSENLSDIVHLQMLGSDGKAASHAVKGCLLLADHNILCEAFYITSYFRNPRYKNVLHYLFKPLNTIWTQPEWEHTFLCDGFGLSCLLTDGCFLKMVYNVVKFCEDELYRSTRDFADDIFSLLHMFLPFLLQLLRCIHSLWKDQFAHSLSEELKSAKVLSNNEEDQQNDTRKLLEQIRDSGYNIIGLSMCLEEAFTDLLDRSSLSLAFVNLDSMEFRHLSKLIELIFLPLVNNCPPELWKEWMLNFLGPFIRHCEDILYYAWFSFLYKGRARVSYYFGKLFGSTKDIEKLEHTILLQFTRDVCHLLGNLSSLESNSLSHRIEDVNNKRITYVRGSEPTSSTSLIGYLFIHDCFGRLRMSLFGYWVDIVAAIKAVPFCRALVRFAGVSIDERLRLFVSNELLPSIIKRLHDQLPCAIRNLIKPNDSVNKDLTALCHESYNYLSSKSSAQGQDLMLECKGRGSAADDFTCWLAKLKEDLCVKAFCAAPEEFKELEVEWNWEFQDEFERYLPVYVDILKEVDAMEYTSEHDYLDWDVLLQKLSPEFRSKYGINSKKHPYLMVISYMRRRKFYSTTQVRNQRNMREIIRKLIARTPYIKGSDCPYSVIDHLQQNPEASFSTFAFDDVEESVQFLFDSVLYFWEPRFHPLIREGNKDLLLWITNQLIKGKEFECFKPLAPSPEDFPLHLKPYALSYIMMKLKTDEYAKAVGQARMHDEYDNHLTSGVLDDNIYKAILTRADFYEKDVDSWAVPYGFSDLDHDLIKLSLKRRAEIVQIDRRVHTYFSCLRGLLEDDSRKGQLTNLMNELEVHGFFYIDNSRIKWENKHLTELVDKFSEVFTDHPLPRHYVIQGIIDYKTISLSTGTTQQSFEKVVGEGCNRLIEYLPQFWRDSRHYRHGFYDIIQQPLEKVVGSTNSSISWSVAGRKHITDSIDMAVKAACTS